MNKELSIKSIILISLLAMTAACQNTDLKVEWMVPENVEVSEPTLTLRNIHPDRASLPNYIYSKVIDVRDSVSFGEGSEFALTLQELNGTANDKNYASLLLFKLSKFSPRTVLVQLANGNSHLLTQFSYNGKLYLADATTGLVYLKSIYEIQQNPSLSSEFDGFAMGEIVNFGPSFLQDLAEIEDQVLVSPKISQQFDSIESRQLDANNLEIEAISHQELRTQILRLHSNANQIIDYTIKIQIYSGDGLIHEELKTVSSYQGLLDIVPAKAVSGTRILITINGDVSQLQTLAPTIIGL